MGRGHWAGLAALCCLALDGCAAPQPTAINTADATALLRTGRPLLRCRDACVDQWRRALPQATQFDARGRWSELAALVLGVGYQDDLSLYYLGRAAEGLGYFAPAASFYRQSLQLSGTTISCRSLSRQCGGVALPAAALARLAVIQREFAHPPPRRFAPAHRVPTAPAAAQAAPSEERVEQEPAPPPPPPEAPKPAAPAPVSPGRSDYIEPPPAVH